MVGRILWIGISALLFAGVCGPASVLGASEPAARQSSDREPGESTSKQPIAPPDVYRQAVRAKNEIELIRFEMGRSRLTNPIVEVKNASPRQVYYQAVTLFRKVNRLCFEVARNDLPTPTPPEGRVAPKHVHALLLVALSRIQFVKNKLGIKEQSPLPRRDGRMSPSDVFGIILQANRQLNLLLNRRFTPSDVYSQVTVSVFHASRLLARFPDATRIPPAPRFERGKTPGDVFLRLLGCFQRIRRLRPHIDSERTELKLAIDVDQAGQIVPSDVFDIALLIQTELRFLDERSTGRQSTIPPYSTGHRIPSHVYQRAGILDAQLRQLEAQLAKP